MNLAPSRRWKDGRRRKKLNMMLPHPPHGFKRKTHLQHILIYFALCTWTTLQHHIWGKSNVKQWFKKRLKAQPYAGGKPLFSFILILSGYNSQNQQHFCAERDWIPKSLLLFYIHISLCHLNVVLFHLMLELFYFFFFLKQPLFGWTLTRTWPEVVHIWPGWLHGSWNRNAN